MTRSAHIPQMTLNDGKGLDAIVKSLSSPDHQEEAQLIEFIYMNEIEMYCIPLQKLQHTMVPQFIFGMLYSRMERFLVVNEYGTSVTLLKMSQQ